MPDPRTSASRVVGVMRRRSLVSIWLTFATPGCKIALRELAMINRSDVCRGFGRLLRQRRTEVKLSQKDFARAVGLSRTSITNIERGRQPVSLPSLYVMADVLQVDVGDLLPTVRSLAIVPHDVLKTLKHVTSKQSNWLGKLAELGPQKRSNAKY